MEPNVFEMAGVAVLERWKSKEGDSYWWLAVEKVVQEWTGSWTNHTDDQRRWELGNCFKTKVEAEQARDKIKEVLINVHRDHGN